MSSFFQPCARGAHSAASRVREAERPWALKPVLLVIAGPNGAGKTTVTTRLRADHWSEGVEYLNPDEIARDRFGDWNSPEAVRSAADWTARRREELLAERSSIAFESVFSGVDKLDFVRRPAASTVGISCASSSLAPRARRSMQRASHSA